MRYEVNSKANPMTHARRSPPDEWPNYIKISPTVALFYRDWGTGKPLLFLSGWTLNSDMWAYQMEPLSRQGFRCIAYDRRAHGRSSDPGGGFDFDTLADDLAAVIEKLDLNGVTLVGHSFASGEMVRYLTRHGAKRVDRLVFVSPAAIPFLLKTSDNPIGIEAAAFDQLRQALASDFPGWAQANAEPYFTPGTSRAAGDWTIRMMTQTSLLAALELNRIQTSTDFRSELGKIDRPTLIVHGTRDASAPIELTGRPAAALIPGARLEVYEGGPHGLYFTHARRLNDHLSEFVSQG
jgi:non-heme chloroperoxidase